MALLSLTQMLDAAIGTPDVATVNFRALRNLLHAMLGHLGLQDRSTGGLEQPAERDRARAPAAGQQPQQPGEQLPAKDPLQDTASGSDADVTADVGQLMEKVETDESSSSEDTSVYQDLLESINQMKEAQSRMQEEICMIQEALGLGNLQDAAGRLPGLCNLRTLASDVQMLKERLGLYPAPEDMNNMVHWDVLEDCLVGSKGERGRDGERPRGEQGDQSAPPKPPTSDMGTPHGASSVLGSRGSSAGLKHPGTALTAPKQQAGVPSDQRRDASTTAMMQTVSQDVQTTSLGTQPTQPESTGTQTTTQGTQPESTVTQTTISGGQLSVQLHQTGPLAAETLLPTAQGFEIPLDTDPRLMSHLQELALPLGSSSAYHNAYNCYMETVEALKQIGQLRHLYAALKEQVAQVEATKLDPTELDKLRLLLQEGGQESIANMLGDLQGQVSSLHGLASDLQGLARDLQGLARDLQGEKGKIRKLESALGKLEAAKASWQMDLSNQLSLPLGSTPQEVKQDMKDLAEQKQISKAALGQLVTQMAEEEQEQLEELRVMESTGQEEAVCPICSSDTSTRLVKLLRCYEKLQGLVDSVISRKKTGKVVRQLPWKSQDQEVLKRIQAAILQMQGEYEKLNSVMGSLLDDSRQQQKDIEGLFQSMERLEKEKADKEDLELGMDEKADKGALESKVSRAQFEASLELLNERNQEMLSRVTGQEQRLHEVQQQLWEEMASKLDRLELGPFQQQLHEHWKSNLEQLKEMAPRMEADDAAGIRKQLLADLQCLSCDRQLSMRVPGTPIPPVPPFPPLVPHVTGQSHPVLKMEQTHRERMVACRYPTVPRQCGGQHTLTHPLQRSLCLQLVQPSSPQALQPSTLLPSKHDKIELLGQDSRTADSCPSAPGTTGPPEHRSASSHSELLQVHQPLPPLQSRRMDAAARQLGRTGGHQLNPRAPAPQQAMK
ncbi:glutamine-rich protein 2-like [Guaruba guarouba]